MTTHWPAPTAAAPVHAVVAVPGSKSITNRALVLAALADGPSTITGGLLARDTRLMIEALRGLGTGIDIQSTQWSVTPAPLRGPVAIDCGLAGTIMRFLPPAACLATGEVRLDGDPRARERPMAPLLAALQHVGADLISADGRLPVLIHGTGRLRGGQVDVDASASSQFISGLLLSAARFDAGIDLRTTGEVPSLPHIDMTVAMLADHGIAVAQETLAGGRRRWMVSHGPIRAADRPVEPDLSNALPFLAAAMVSGGSVTIPHWPAQTTQPGGDLPRLLRAMGGMCTLSEDGLTVAGPRRLSGLVTDLRDVGELTPVLAALAALADTPSRFTGIGHLRGHETDRLAALATELNALGGRVKQEPDGLLIEPAALRPGIFATYDDHRMATAAAVLGLVVPGVEVENVETTDKTLPDFLGMWTSMLAGAGR